ncbi:PucR family transcriptional regulator [Pseudonocardia acidicola]|uniref:PucR-like helix-turn-helix protein n=1 Tax=Pseudonocardia acidicola TaxID=2724939 RepID=A0ABX1S7Z1_9PSEU|nr:helix-turn-helix domain-containing protein [Pseudonocardia acidicola]NMH97671.1 hypothetical protein [Pseudonocardia acidicola]
MGRPEPASPAQRPATAPTSVPAPAPAAHGRDRRENVLLRELVAVYSHLSGLASQDTEVGGVLRLVAARTGAGATVLTSTLDVLAAVPDDVGDRLRDGVGATRLAQVLAASARNRRPVTLRGLDAGAGVIAGVIVVAPILVGDDVPAHLVTLSGHDERPGDELDDDLSLLLTEHAATICGIIIGRDRVVAAAAGRARRDLIEALLLARDRDDGEAERWAGHLGLARGVDHHVLAVGVATAAPAGVAGPRGRVLDLAEHALSRRAPTAVVAGREHEVVAVVPAGDIDPRALGEHCLDVIAQRHPDSAVVVGVGGRCRGPADIARSYAEARRAIDASARMGRSGRVVAFDDLGIHRLLLQVPDLGELRAFATDVLGELVADREHRADLLSTLTAWFRCNGSPQRTARELHVHPNTVSYRIRRVEEIAGLRLDSYRDRLMAQVACEIVTALGERG